MTQDMDQPEDGSAAAEYTLGLLTAQEARAFEDAMARDPQMRADYAFWAENYAALTDDIAPVTPPASVWTRIAERAFGATPKRSLFARFGLWSAVGGGVIAAVAVLWMINLTGVMRWLEPPLYTAQIAAEDESLIVQASYDEAAMALSLTRSVGGAAEGRDLELWLIAGDAAPVSLGVLPAGQTAVVAVDAALVPALAGGVLAISDEPAGGSPTGAPTGAVLAVGPIITL